MLFPNLDSYHSTVGECISVCHAITALTLIVLHIVGEYISICHVISALTLIVLHIGCECIFVSCNLSLGSYVS